MFTRTYDIGMFIGIHIICTTGMDKKKILTSSVARLSTSRRLPDESYRGVTVSVGGLGAAQKIHLHSCNPNGKKECFYSQKFKYDYKNVDTSVTYVEDHDKEVSHVTKALKWNGYPRSVIEMSQRVCDKSFFVQ